MDVLNQSLLSLSSKLTSFEETLEKKLKELDKKGLHWFKMDFRRDELLKEGRDKRVSLDIGGRRFFTTLGTLLSQEDTVFYNLILTEQWDPQEELFIDRSYKHFDKILSYLRHSSLDLLNFSSITIAEILEEADFYKLEGLRELLEKALIEIKFLGFTCSGLYRSGNRSAGTNNIEDLNNTEDRSLLKGICTDYTGWIEIEFNREAEFEEIEIGGYNGNTSLYAASNGANSQISTSMDRSSWTQVGVTPSDYGAQIKTVKLTRSKAKFIKFQCGSYLGIGYLRIIPI